MNTLPIYLLNLINNYNNNITIIYLYQTSKYYKDLLENNKNKIIKIKDNIVDLYSSVIISLMGGIKNILDYPELEWDDKYLYPHLSKRDILTYSSVQARKKINTKSIDSWKNYIELLKPAKKILLNSNSKYTKNFKF